MGVTIFFPRKVHYSKQSSKRKSQCPLKINFPQLAQGPQAPVDTKGVQGKAKTKQKAVDKEFERIGWNNSKRNGKFLAIDLIIRKILNIIGV